MMTSADSYQLVVIMDVFAYWILNLEIINARSEKLIGQCQSDKFKRRIGIFFFHRIPPYDASKGLLPI